MSWGSVNGAGAPRTCEEEGRATVGLREGVCACVGCKSFLNVFFLVILFCGCGEMSQKKNKV